LNFKGATGRSAIESNDLDRAKTFYDAILGTMKCAPGVFDPKGRVVYRHDGQILLITKPIDGHPATVGNGMTTGFAASSPEITDAWHEAGIAHGGKAIENPPGVRQSGLGRLYLADLRDPDGNTLYALHRMQD